jgi:hypothetical protein
MDDDLRVFTQLMYDKINTMADNPEQIVTKMNAHEAQYSQEVTFESIKLLPLAMTQGKSEKQISKQTWKSRSSGSESDRSSLESEKHRRSHTHEWYRYHQTGHIAWYCPSTALVESAAPTETAAVMTTSIGNYCVTVTNRESPSKESWYLDCATTTHIWGDQRKFKQ